MPRRPDGPSKRPARTGPPNPRPRSARPPRPPGPPRPTRSPRAPPPVQDPQPAASREAPGWSTPPARPRPARASAGAAASPRPAKKKKKRNIPKLPPVEQNRIPEALTDANRGERIQKVLATAGVASRRDAEQMILDGRVSVNGDLVTGLPAWVDPRRDQIEVDGKIINRPDAAGHLTKAAGPRFYVMLYKPRGVISTTDDDIGRKNVTEMVQLQGARGMERLYPVGRLDADTTGLILLTNDGEMAHRLTHPSYGITKEYMVSVKGLVQDSHLEQLKKGLYLAHRKQVRQSQRNTPPAPGSPGSPGIHGSGNPAPGSHGPGSGPHAGGSFAPRSPRADGRPPNAGRRSPSATPATPGSPGTPGSASETVVVKKATMESVQRLDRQVDREHGDRSTLLITLREGQNREIRRMLARLGLKVRKLARVAIGPLKLKGIKSGKWRQLSPSEIKDLRRAVGL